MESIIGFEPKIATSIFRAIYNTVIRNIIAIDGRIFFKPNITALKKQIKKLSFSDTTVE